MTKFILPLAVLALLGMTAACGKKAPPDSPTAALENEA